MLSFISFLILPLQITLLSNSQSALADRIFELSLMQNTYREGVDPVPSIPVRTSHPFGYTNESFIELDGCIAQLREFGHDPDIGFFPTFEADVDLRTAAIREQRNGAFHLYEDNEMSEARPRGGIEFVDRSGNGFPIPFSLRSYSTIEISAAVPAYELTYRQNHTSGVIYGMENIPNEERARMLSEALLAYQRDYCLQGD